jgi:hypothetical protein
MLKLKRLAIFSLIIMFAVLFIPDKLAAEGNPEVETSIFSEIGYDGTIKATYNFNSTIAVTNPRSGVIVVRLGSDLTEYNNFDVFEGMLTAYRDRGGHTSNPLIIGSNWIAYPVSSRNSYFIYHNKDFKLNDTIRSASLGMGFTQRVRDRIKRKAIRKSKRKKGKPWEYWYLKKIRSKQGLRNR